MALIVPQIQFTKGFPIQDQITKPTAMLRFKLLIIFSRFRDCSWRREVA